MREGNLRMTALTLPVNHKLVIEELPESSRHLISFDKKYLQLMKDMSGILIDRTKTIDFYNGAFDFPNITPIPKITTPLSTEECIEESVFQLSVIAKHKKIYILWSGGIDSSVALLGIWKYGKRLFNNNEVTVLHSPSSVRESPFLYDWIVKNKILTEEVGSVTKYLKDQPQGSSGTSDEKNIYVTGELGDQIMGNFHNLSTFPLLNDEENFLSKDIFSFLKPIHDKEKKDAWGEAAHLLYDNRKTDIETVFDMLSWITFTCKYEHPKYRLWLSAERRIPTYNFFDTDEFQNWSLNNNWREKCNGNWWTQYKMTWKKFIYDITGNEHALTMYKQSSLVIDHIDEIMQDRRTRYIDQNFEVRSIFE
jgi:hypothetical protein